MQAETTRAQQVDAAFEAHHEEGNGNRAGGAHQDDLVQRIASAQPLDERVLQNEKGDRPDDADDPEYPMIHVCGTSPAGRPGA